jgi:hypothetical protein
VGNLKEADARQAYLTYHQDELRKVRGIMNLAGDHGSLMEIAVKDLQVLGLTPPPLAPPLSCLDTI